MSSACGCSCHKTDRPCGVCCAEVAKKFLEVPDAKDKSKEVLDKFFKGRK